MPFLPPDTDIAVAQLTLAGRNLLARSIMQRGKVNSSDSDLPLVSFKLAGFAAGDGGYSLSNPLLITSINDQTAPAIVTVAILDNRFYVNDSLIINGVPFRAGVQIVHSGTATGGTEAGGPNGHGTLTVTSGSLSPNAHVGQRLRITSGLLGNLDELIESNDDGSVNGIEITKTWTAAGGGGSVPDTSTNFQIITATPGANTWVPGVTLEETAENIAERINASTNPLIQNIVRASVAGAILTITALADGALGNLNTLVEIDSSGINNFGIEDAGDYSGDFSNSGSGVGAGGSAGAPPALESVRFPAAAPTTVESFTDIEYPNASAVSLVCRLDSTEGNYGLGEIGIYVDITDSVNPAEIGTRVLYAITHFPIVAHNANSNFVTRVITQY